MSDASERHSAFRAVAPAEVSTGRFHQLMLGAVAPRPIAFASTVDAQGRVNLSPYSFFNAFSSNPPTLVFSPARRVRDNTTKHTLDNVHEHPEVVINIVSYAMVEQMSLSSTEYPKGVNEFVKAGFTEAPSVRVRPPRVAEAPAAFECRVKEVIALGDQGGAGNLIVAEVLLAHFREDIFSEDQVDPRKLDAVGRMGGNWYCRAHGEALFEVAKPLRKQGIGVDLLPAEIRLSPVLTGNDLGKLGNVEALPTAEEIAAYADSAPARQLRTDGPLTAEARHRAAQRLLAEQKVAEAWLMLLQQDGVRTV